MSQEFDKQRFTLFELIRKPRRKGKRWVAGMENVAPGAGVLMICIILLLATPYVARDNRYDIVGMYLAVVAALIYFNFDFKNIKEILHYKDTDYYKHTGIPFRKLLNDKGLLGEFYTYLLYQHLKSYHKMLFNTYIPMPNGSFQEIDAILLSEEGIFAIEAKNRDGFFRGDYGDKKWIQYIGSQQHEMHSPVEQNRMHIISLDHYLKTNKKLLENSERNPYYYLINSIIIFGEGVQFDLSGKLPGLTSVQNRKEALEYINHDLNKFNHKQLTPHDIDLIYQELLPLSTYSEQVRKSKLEWRERMSQAGQFRRHDYQYYEYKGATEQFRVYENNQHILRKDGVYTELYLERFDTWIAAPELDQKYMKQISEG